MEDPNYAKSAQALSQRFVFLLDTLSALREESGGDQPVVVFCTTENDYDHISRAISAGADEYVMKPFDREIIEAKFQEVGLL